MARISQSSQSLYLPLVKQIQQISQFSCLSLDITLNLHFSSHQFIALSKIWSFQCLFVKGSLFCGLRISILRFQDLYSAVSGSLFAISGSVVTCGLHQGLQTLRLSPREVGWGRLTIEGSVESRFVLSIISVRRCVLSASFGGELGADKWCLSERWCLSEKWCLSTGELGGEG